MAFLRRLTHRQTQGSDTVRRDGEQSSRAGQLNPGRNLPAILAVTALKEQLLSAVNSNC